MKTKIFQYKIKLPGVNDEVIDLPETLTPEVIIDFLDLFR